MDRITGESFATRSEVLAQDAMVATSQPLATQAGLEILRQGGTAVDAALAANAVLTLVEPTGCGLGGDLFAIVWDSKTQKLHGLNASGRSPESLTLGEFKKRGLNRIPAFGPLPVTVPGAVDGWFELHQRFGKLPMAEILAPAIHYAKKGFPVTELISHDWEHSIPILGKWPGFLETFTRNGKAPGKGEIFKNPGLSETLETLVREGRDAFYKGSIAHVVADYMRENGGFLSTEDLAKHRSDWVEPVCTTYRGAEVWELPPNGQGIAALQLLNLLEGYDIASMGFGSTEHVHFLVEAKKLVFEDRARFYADPAFNRLPLQGLISKEYAAKRRETIHPERVMRRVDAGNPALEEGDTVYLSAADSERNMVSLIQSNYRGMGSGMTPPGLGFVLQDRGELFSLEAGHFNVYEPRKRPFHTIIPAFVTRNKQPWISFGVMGGATQPQAHAQILMNLLDFGMNLQEAGDAPRILHTGSSQPTGEVMTDGGKVYLESGFAEKTIRELVKMGHQVGWAVGPYGGYQAIQYDRENDVYIGASESRKDGHAAGY